MKSKIFIIGIVLMLSLAAANAAEFICDATGLSNPVIVPESTDSAWVLPLKFSQIPLIIPFDGSPLITPENDSAIFVIPFDGSRPTLHFVETIITLPMRIVDDVKVIKNCDVIFVPINNETEIIKLAHNYVTLPHGKDLAPILGVSTEQVNMDHAIIIPVHGLADEPLIVELEGNKTFVSLEGGGGGIYLQSGENPTILEGDLRVTDSLITYIGYTSTPMFVHLQDSGMMSIGDLTNELSSIRTCCATEE